MTIVIVAYHADRWLPRCLESLLAASASRLHLVLVDNSGNTVIPAIDLSGFDTEVLATPRPMGFAEANNFALVRAHRLAPYILFLNQDTVSTPGWVDACTQLMDRETSVAALTPATRDYELRDWERYFLECACRSPAFRAEIENGRVPGGFYEVPMIPAAAMIVRCETLLEVGPFDPIFVSYYEDYDLCERIRLAGGRIGVLSGATVGHFSGSASISPAAERRRARWITRNRVIQELRRPGTSRIGHLIRQYGYELPRGIARSVLGRPGSKPLTAWLLGHIDLLRVVPRVASARRDRTEWQRYLKSQDWTSRITASRGASCN